MNTGIGVSIGAVIIFLVVCVVVFLVCRELLCWYWKINQSIALLTEIRDLLKANRVVAPTSPPLVPLTPPPAMLLEPTGPMGSCPNCSATIPMSSADCPKCKASFGVGSAWKITHTDA